MTTRRKTPPATVADDRAHREAHQAARFADMLKAIDSWAKAVRKSRTFSIVTEADRKAANRLTARKARCGQVLLNRMEDYLTVVDEPLSTTLLDNGDTVEERILPGGIMMAERRRKRLQVDQPRPKQRRRTRISSFQFGGAAIGAVIGHCRTR